MTSSSYLRIRGTVERIVAAICLAILLPIFGLLAVAIRLKMGSPILFRQVRVGQYGKEFEILKFRTMVHQAETLGGGYMPPELNLIPPLGKFLRSASLDEIPQLLNIIRGEMSFVGPRPALPDQYRRYSEEQAGRVAVPQGITGLAQIRFRNNAPWSIRINSDLEYVENLGPRLDLIIFVRTFLKLIKNGDIKQNQTITEVDDLG